MTDVISNHIMWTPAKLVRFKAAYALHHHKGDAEFIFDGHTFVVAYAKYLIEYLNGRFK